VKFTDENLPPAARGKWTVTGTIPLWFAWTVLMANEIEQSEFHRREFASPLPVYRELWAIDGDIYVIERINEPLPVIGFSL
jgi:hypothetical protein